MEQHERALRAELARYGLTLTTSVAHSGRTAIPHWQVRDAGTVVLHVWPRKGSWWRPGDGAKGVADRWEQLAQLAGMAPFPPGTVEYEWWGPPACERCKADLAKAKASVLVPFLCRGCALALERAG